METRDGTIKLPKKAAKVRNKAPAPLQITAEQLLHEAKSRELDTIASVPKSTIADLEELREVQLRKRKEFENNLRKNRSIMINWIKYAKWEETQGELQRARSIFERALDVDHRSIGLWLQYAELEMRNKQVNHARNIWDRCVMILPRANQFWYKYTYMEEILGNVAGCRQVFERWTEWEPDEQAWLTFIKFEMRYKEVDRARQIYQRFINCHPDVKNWIRYAKFEERQGSVSAARQVYEQAVQYFGDDDVREDLLSAFAKFEENQKEHDRCRVIYKFALDRLPKEKTDTLFKFYTIHEKKYGDKFEIENVIVSKRKQQYEDQIEENPYNYDAWFDYIRLLETEEDVDLTRDAYERAIANVPPEQVKRYWRRYIYFWINYALFEELEAKDIDRTREVYKTCLEIIPHSVFTFSKMWILFAHFEMRQKNLQAARKIMGTAIGKCPKDKTFREYITMELELREFDRCRTLYTKWLEFSPENCTSWIKYAEMEELLGETDRSRAIFELATNQPALDMPEVLWKAYIDFEVREEGYERAQSLYERLLEKTQHVKVWLSFAKFQEEIKNYDAARDLYQRANRELAISAAKEERLLLLEQWREFEQRVGSEHQKETVEKEFPKKVKKRKEVEGGGWEEFYDYIFPADEAAQANLKLLEMAKKWKEGDISDSSSEDEGEVKKEKSPESEKSEKVREGDSDTDISDDSDDDV